MFYDLLASVSLEKKKSYFFHFFEKQIIFPLFTDVLLLQKRLL